PNRVSPDGVVPPPYVRFAPPEAHVPDHHIVRIDPDRFPGHANPVAGSRLPGDRDIRRPDDQRALQPDDPRHVEHDDPRPTLLAGPAERSRAAVFQTGNHQHFTAP